ncbi:MAG TPA: DUF2968 domain-containing protein [Paraburkholderia sp.]|jgi:hypothetical protein
MKYPLPVRRALLLATTCVLLQHGGLVRAAANEVAASAAAVPPVLPAVGAALAQPDGAARRPNATFEAAAGAQGDVAELMRSIQDATLTELRTTYNGGYGAALFFRMQDLTYYVALFQDKHFWRVIKSQDEGRADEIYANFAQQTSQLADVEIRRTKLLAQTAFIERVIGLSENRAKRLQADLDVARSQQAKVTEYQRQIHGETLTLRDEKEKAQLQLRELQQQVLQLQRQTEAGLPVVK